MTHTGPAVGHVHLIGVLGQGMSTLSRFFSDLGWQVSGCDARAPDAPHSPEHIRPGIDLVVHSLAIPSTHPELVAARRGGVRIATRPVALATLLDATSNWVTAISGVTGKSSTTALLAQMYVQGGITPTVYVGAEMPTAKLDLGFAGPNGVAVVESCEVAHGMLELTADTAAVTSQYWGEHVATYATPASLESAFASFAGSAGNAILPLHETGLTNEVSRNTRSDILTFGTGSGATVRLSEYRSSAQGFRAAYHVDGQRIPVQTQLYGRHNALNLAAAMACHFAHTRSTEGLLAIDYDELEVPRRRIEYLGTFDGIHFFDDFGHNPVQMTAAISVLRERFPGATLGAFYLPSGHARLAAFGGRYTASLANFDSVVLARAVASFEDTASPRDSDDFSGRTVVELTEAGCRAKVREVSELRLADFAGCDVVCFFGALRMNGVLPRLLADTFRPGRAFASSFPGGSQT